MSIELWLIVAMALLMGVGGVIYYDMASKLKKIRNEEQKIREHARQKAENLLNEARDQALAIVSEANILSEEQTRELKIRLREVVDRKLKSFEEMILEISAGLGKNSEDQVKGFSKTLEMETLGMEKAISAKAEASFSEVQAEIGKYKKQKMKKIDEEIFAVISEVATKTVGKIIPIHDHESLIMDALKEAKENHVI